MIDVRLGGIALTPLVSMFSSRKIKRTDHIEECSAHCISTRRRSSNLTAKAGISWNR